MIADAAATLYTRLLSRPESLLKGLAPVPVVEHPRVGRVEGREAVSGFAGAWAQWLVQRRASAEPVVVTRTPRRTVAEWLVRLALDGREVRLPVAVVGDHADAGHTSALRVYHSTFPLTGRHAVRPRLLPSLPELEAEDVVGRYQAALAAGDVEAVVACFTEDGVAREPAGAAYAHRGPDELRAFYSGLFAAGGGIALEHATITDDDVRCAIEYTVVRWGRHELAPQAGVAVYERAPDGRLAAARIYDDVDPPSP